MRWEMEVEEVEAVLERIWDLHDKLSDAIHSISRTHFLNSIKSLRKSNPDSAEDCFVHHHHRRRSSSDPKKGCGGGGGGSEDDGNRPAGFVFRKDFLHAEEDDSAVQEAKSLNAIRTALENLEDQLEFFHTVQTQQRAERDAAIARLEQSRIVLAVRLAEHRGKKYKVIDEARAFVGDVHDAARFVTPEDCYGTADLLSGDDSVPHEGKRSNIFPKFFISGLNFAKKSLKLDTMGGFLGNAALFAVSMLAFLHLHQVVSKDKCIIDLPQRQEGVYHKNVTKVFRPEASANGRLSQLDVLLARG